MKAREEIGYLFFEGEDTEAEAEAFKDRNWVTGDSPREKRLREELRNL